MTDKRHYHGHRERLRGRLARDSRALADYEILELLLGYVLTRQDTKPLAKALLERFGTLKGVFAARGQDLRAVKGFGPRLETYWTLWRETWARLAESPVEERQLLGSPDDVARMAIARLGAGTTEEFWMVLVDARNRLLAWEPINRGTVDKVQMYVPEMMETVIRHKAKGFIMVHNHPGGDPEPSANDRRLTAKAYAAAQTLDIRLLDHIIVTVDGYYSFKSEGLLE